MLRQFLLGKIHRCTVTRADLNYIGSVTIDPILMEAAGFLENEKVEIYNITNGSRFA
ncbi:MAG: aspartate 1-decarboxylase, partial [Holophagales bacterium]|nr:aspartate 1-decarboxylase [Holophagales bacterium]